MSRTHAKLAAVPAVGILLAAAMASAAPAAETTTTSTATLDAISTKVITNVALTDTDKATLTAAIRKQSPNATDQQLAAVYDAYNAGDPTRLEAYVTTSVTTAEHTKHSTLKLGGAQTAALDPVCAANENWVAVTDRGYNIFGQELASLRVEKDWGDNCQCVIFGWDGLSYNITGTGSLLGWHFEDYTTHDNHYFKYNGLSCGGHRTYVQASFTGCPIRVGCTSTFNPWIQIDGRAGPGPDTAWRTDQENYTHYID